MRYLHYTDFIHEEQRQRRLRNPSYSSRAFARSIGLSPSFLNLLLKRKRDLSMERAKEVALNINWSTETTYSFLEMVKQQSPEKTAPPSKVVAVLFSTRARFYAGEGSLTRLDDGTKINFLLQINLSHEHRADGSSLKQIFTRYSYETGQIFDLDFRLLDSGDGTFRVHCDGMVIGEGFFVGRICHVDVNFKHPVIGPLHSSISYVFTGNRVSASGRNFTTNTTFQQVTTAIRAKRKSVLRKNGLVA